jgi:hypothetical protein
MMSRLLREFVVHRILRRLGRELRLDPAEAPMRVNLVASQMTGLILTRYIIRIEPLASASPDQVAALIGPTVQRYVTGPLPLD